MDTNIPLHGYIHITHIFAIVLSGYICVIGNKIYVRRKQKNRMITNIILTIILLFYTAVYVYLTFLYRTPMKESHIRTIPFWSYREAFSGWTIQRLSVARSIFLNILLFIPLGYLLPSLMLSFSHRYLFTIIIIISLSIGTEIIQYYTRTGLCELDDLINNTVGGLLGMAGYVIGDQLISEKRHLKQ